MRVDAEEVQNSSEDFRVLDSCGSVVPKVVWADTDTGEFGSLRQPWGPEVVTCGAPFSVVRWPSREMVAVYHGNGSKVRRRMRMHIDDALCDDDLRVLNPDGEMIRGVRWFDTDAEQVGKLLTDERGVVRWDEPWPMSEEVLHTPFRVVDSRDGSFVIASRSLQ